MSSNFLLTTVLVALPRDALIAVMDSGKKKAAAIAELCCLFFAVPAVCLLGQALQQRWPHSVAQESTPQQPQQVFYTTAVHTSRKSRL